VETILQKRSETKPASLTPSEDKEEISAAEDTTLSERNDDIEFFDELAAFIRVVQDNYDIVVIDCRPDVAMLTTNALQAATGLIIPVLPNMVDMQSLSEFAGFLSTLDEQIAVNHDNRGLNFDSVRILPTLFRPTDKSHTALLEYLTKIMPHRMMGAEMLHTNAIGIAAIKKWTLYEWAPKAGYRDSHARAIAAADQVNRIIETDIRRAWGVNPNPVSLPIRGESRKTSRSAPPPAAHSPSKRTADISAPVAAE
jgi:chromosome partitioning protein